MTALLFLIGFSCVPDQLCVPTVAQVSRFESPGLCHIAREAIMENTPAGPGLYATCALDGIHPDQLKGLTK